MRRTREAVMRVKGTLLQLGTRNYCFKEDCQHIEIVRETLSNRLTICSHCGLQNRLPLHFDLEGGLYVLRCQFCHEVLWQE